MIKKYPFKIEEETKLLLESKVMSYLKTTSTTELHNISILNDFPLVLSQLKEVLKKYTKDFNFDFQLTKSWGILLTPSTPDTKLHSHGYCNFSFVFYTKKEEDSNIVFKDLNNIDFEVPAGEDEIIVFPSYLPHYIKGNNKETRISFAGDILVTSLDKLNYSEFLTPVETWIKL
jgi:hypothetical protein